MNNVLKNLGDSEGGQADSFVYNSERVGPLEWDGSGCVIFVYFQKMAFDRKMAMIIRYKILHVTLNLSWLMMINNVFNRLGNICFCFIMLELKKTR